MSYARRIDDRKHVRLADIDPADTGGVDRLRADTEADVLGKELDELCELLFAAGENALLIVFQGLDTSGKDGSIRSILQHTDVQNCRVVPFKVPTPEEKAHDFLWRVHIQVPAHGAIAMFNRSHYEDIVAVRVRKLASEDVWKARYDQVNDFERLLTDTGTIIVKFFLHISKDEQERRLLDREKDPVKAWKLSVDDWRDRLLWDDYLAAYEDVLARCGTESSPWNVVPADRKWFRNLAVLERLVKTLRPYHKRWRKRLEEMGEERRRQLEAFRTAAKMQAVQGN